MTEENGKTKGSSVLGITTSAGISQTKKRPSDGSRGSPARQGVEWRVVIFGLCLALLSSGIASMIAVPLLTIGLMPVDPVPAFLMKLLIMPIALSVLLLYLFLAAAIVLAGALVLYLTADTLQALARGRLPALAQLLLHLVVAPAIPLLVASRLAYLPPYDLSFTDFLMWVLAVSFVMGCLSELLLCLASSGSSAETVATAILRRMHSIMGIARRRGCAMTSRPGGTVAATGLALLSLALVDGPWRDVWSTLFGNEYELIDSGVNSSQRNIYWLDNNRVIFLSWNKELSPPANEIMIWNIKDNTVSRYRTIPSSSLCYGSGRVFYGLGIKQSPSTEERVRYYMAGPLGKETKHTMAIGEHFYKRHSFVRRECRYVSRPEVVPPEDGWLMLYSRHGFLRSTSIKDEFYYRILYYENGNNSPIELPFKGRKDVWAYPTWHEFKHAYFFQGPATAPSERKQWRRTGCWKAWWLYPNGKTKRVCIPAGVWAKVGTDGIAPVRDGYFLSVKASSEDATGAYVSLHGESQKIVGGYPGAPAVSPNGCRVAFVHTSGDGRPSTLKMVNLCNGS